MKLLFKYQSIFLLCTLLNSSSAYAEKNPFLPPYQVSNLPTNPSAPLTTETLLFSKSIPLNYANAKSLCSSLKELFNSKLSADTSTNSLLFYGTKQEYEELLHLIQKIDIATHQVTLEAKIIALSREDSENLGVNWNWDTIPQKETSIGEKTSSNEKNEKFGGNFKFWRGYSFRFNASLNALIANGKAKVLALPRIITIPGNEASIFIGDHIPVQTEKHDNTGTYTATEYLDAGINLRYTPIISKNGKMVTANVHTEVSTPILISELKNYRITSRTADTNVRMYSGETLIIGGLINEEEQRSIQQVPLLSKIPFLGELFKNRTKRYSKTEVIILLTPYITEAGQSPAIYTQQTK